MEDYFLYGIIALPFLYFLYFIFCMSRPCWGCYSGITENYRRELEEQYGVKFPEPTPDFHDDDVEWAKHIHRLWEEKTGKESPLSFWINLPF